VQTAPVASTAGGRSADTLREFLTFQPERFQLFAPDSRVHSQDREMQDLAMGEPSNIVPADIVSRIVSVRGQRVLLDSDLAAVYGVTTKRLNQQVNRNIERFPADFIFHLDSQELANLKLQFATSSLSERTHGGARRPPRMFTEHGAIMAATVLNSPRALESSSSRYTKRSLD
jgi:hypothetical protein